MRIYDGPSSFCTLSVPSHLSWFLDRPSSHLGASISVVYDHQKVTVLVRHDCAMLSERRVLYQRVKNPYSYVPKCQTVIQFRFKVSKSYTVSCFFLCQNWKDGSRRLNMGKGKVIVKNGKS